MRIVNSCTNGTTIFREIQSAIKLAESEGISCCKRYIDITYHFVCDVASRNEFQLEYKSTFKMVSDALTKPLQRKTFECTIKLSGLQGKGEQSKLIKECSRKHEYFTTLPNSIFRFHINSISFKI